MIESPNDPADVDGPLTWLCRGVGWAIVLMPVLWWSHGPVVSDDQRWVRVGVVAILAVTACVCLRRVATRRRLGYRRNPAD